MPKKQETKKQVTKLDFEEALDELNNIVETMEEGELTLESSLKEFERGIKLTRHCQKALKEAEQKVEILISENGSQKNDQLEPFKDDNQDRDES